MTKRQLRAMSPAETEILRLAWQLEEATVQQICDLLPRGRDIGYKTVQTLLRRLENKGYLKHRTKGKAFVFSPAIKREDVVKRTVVDFLDRLFGGDPRPLMQFLAEDGRIDVEDIIAMAERLGKAISSSPEAVALRAAQSALQADAEGSKALADFQTHTQKVAQLEHFGRFFKTWARRCKAAHVSC